MHNGQWGTICNDLFDLSQNGPNVVCRQLGHSFGQYESFGPDYDTPIWLDQVHCTGMEWSIDECEHDEWGTHDCTHVEDAGVICFGDDEDDEESGSGSGSGSGDSSPITSIHFVAFTWFPI